ncbi:hypothetical protein CIRG_06561 [Coccidioides immitis RMSCC 2394]|uniref:Zn(2)-C6 fungal-type domain-containing protein n=1 Tax=Coccidioides immitis RMSCC 2394 TaxID=404692 RepID=A0A0J6YGX9_COCIT|nr:hypothetical protein CIRG_06561 [Coccidioides immitis RMSCC 2394]
METDTDPSWPACDRCHRRKSRCDKQVPLCGPCMKAGVPCVYTDRSKEPTYRKEVVERLERRLKQCEATNRALAARLASANSQLAAATGVNGASSQDRAMAALPQDQQQQQQQQPRSDSDNEVTDEVSFLSLTAGGERQFLGSGSGVLFANLVRATVEATSAPTSSIALKTREFQRNSPYPAGGLPGSLASIPKTDLSQIPPELFARDLHHAYFEHDHLCYPFLHRPTVLASFEHIYADPSSLDRDHSAAFVYYMILAISSVDFHKFDWQTRPDAENFHAIALARLNEVLQLGGIKALQAILLLVQYRMRSSIQDTSASMWHLVGVAARICFELGLHRELVYQVRQTPDPSGLSATDQFIRSETKRRCFFCVVAMDRVVSITLGRPFAIRLEDIDVSLPDSQFDLDITPPGSSFHPSTGESFSRTALFVHIVRYRTLCGKILASLHSGKRPQQKVEDSAALEVRESLAAELEAWRHDTASLNLPAVDLSSAIPGDRSSFRAHEWYEILYHNAILMLYRPSPAFSAVSTKVPVSIQTIFMAAKQSITLYAHLHRSRRINYTWITLHAVFMAGLSYVYAVGRHFRAKRRIAAGGHATTMLDEDPSIIEIVNETRACSNVLVAVSERWSASRNSHDVFHRLSDAVLADAIELLSSPPQSSATSQHPQGSMPIGGLGSPSSMSMSGMAHMNNTTSTPGGLEASWPEMVTSPPLAVDSVLRDCFRDLQNIHEHGCGDDPIGRLSQDWLGEIGGMSLEAVQIWGE